MNNAAIQFTTPVDRLLSFCGHMVLNSSQEVLEYFMGYRCPIKREGL